MLGTWRKIITLIYSIHMLSFFIFCVHIHRIYRKNARHICLYIKDVSKLHIFGSLARKLTARIHNIPSCTHCHNFYVYTLVCMNLHIGLSTLPPTTPQLSQHQHTTQCVEKIHISIGSKHRYQKYLITTWYMSCMPSGLWHISSNPFLPASPLSEPLAVTATISWRRRRVPLSRASTSNLRNRCTICG